MTDSELRAAIEAIYNKSRQMGMLRVGSPIEYVVTEVEALLKAQLTAERTAIKAALPEKLERGQYLIEANLPIKDVLLRSKNAEVYKIAYPQGWNNAIDQVTQVIDGRDNLLDKHFYEE